MTSRWIVLLALAVPGSLAAQRATRPTARAPLPSFEFRGHVLTDSLRGLPDCSPTDESCYSTDRIGEVPVTIIYNQLDGRFEALYIQFEPAGFALLRDAFVAKWGAPSSVETPPYRTVGGAKTTNTILRWIFAQGTLTLSHYASSLSDATAMIYSPRYGQMLEAKRRRDAAKAAGKDM